MTIGIIMESILSRGKFLELAAKFEVSWECKTPAQKGGRRLEMLTSVLSSVGAQQQEQISRPAGALGRGQQQAVLWSLDMNLMLASSGFQRNREMRWGHKGAKRR
ncbi:MAG: hypothetical protein WBC92_04195 [Terracidiphilus sp.]